MVAEDIQTWYNEINDSYKEFRSYIDEHPLVSVVPYEQLTKKTFYTAYSNVLEISNEISRMANKVVKLGILRVQFKKLIRNNNYPSSIRTEMTAKVEEGYELLSSVDKFVSNYKIGLDNQIRFYQSIQYFLASPRLNDID